MSIHSLPSKVLQHIFALAQTLAVIEIDWFSHRDFRKDLLSFSLVHSSWTRSAQSLLLENVWIRGGNPDNEKISQGIESNRFKETPVRALSISGGGGDVEGWIRKAAESSQWSKLAALRLYWVQNVDFVDLAQLPNLRDIFSSNGGFKSSSHEISFPRLSSFTFINTILPSTITEAQSMFSNTSMLNLTSLALCVGPTLAAIEFSSVFENVLPQITSLAVKCTDPTPQKGWYHSITSALPRMDKLKHLSLILPPQILLEFLPDGSGGIKLENMHLKFDISSDVSFAGLEMLLVFMIAAVGGDTGTNLVRAKQVYVYGDKKKMKESSPDLEKEIEDLCWVKGECPFAGFDGKFMGTLQ